MRIRSLPTPPPASGHCVADLAAWHDVPDGPVGEVVQDWHDQHVHGYRVHPDDERPGMVLWLGPMEGEEEWA